MRYTIAVAALLLVACGKEPAATAPTYTQADYAKNADADCVRVPAGFYDEKAKTPKGIEEVIFTACQAAFRAEYRGRLALEGAGQQQSFDHANKAILCTSEVKDAVATLRKVGVTSARCPDGKPLM